MKTRLIILITIFLVGFYYGKNEKEILSFVETISLTDKDNWEEKWNNAHPEMPYKAPTKGGSPIYVKKEKGGSPIN